MNINNKMQNSVFVKSTAPVKVEPNNYINEIRQMMHGFGDSSEPLIESAKIIDEIVLQQMRTIVNKACRVAEERGSNVVIAEDFIFLLRKDKVKLQRLIKYLDLMHFKSRVNRTVSSELPEIGGEDPGKSENHQYQEFLELIDTTGQLMDDSNAFDQVKYDRNIRADNLAKQLDEARYLEYSKARRVSFVNKNKHKFSDWVGVNGDFTVDKKGYIILSYLAYETVAQIVDLSFLVRQDQMKLYGDSIDRVRFSYCNPKTYKPYQHNQSSFTKPITPSEIYEAMRRFWSPQIDVTGPFYRSSMRKPHLKLLTC